MDHASTINFLSNEDTPELAPGYFIATEITPRRLLDDCVLAFRSRLPETVERIRARFPEGLCPADDLAYYAFTEWAIYRMDGARESARRAADLLVLIGRLSDQYLANAAAAREAVRAAVSATGSGGSVTEAAPTLAAGIARNGRLPEAPMDGMFRPTYYLRACIGLRDEGYLQDDEMAVCARAIERSLQAITAHTDWGPHNRGLIKALNLMLAAKCFPDHSKADAWMRQGRSMAGESIGAWSIEDAQIYLPIWMHARWVYEEHFGSRAALRSGMVRFYFDYMRELQLPIGFAADFGDARWMDSSDVYFFCYKAAAALYRDGSFAAAADALWRAWTGTCGTLGALTAKQLPFLAEAILAEDPSVVPEARPWDSAEILEDLIGKKYRLANGTEDGLRYLMLNYRDEGNYAIAARSYLRSTIPVPHEKTHHGHSDENSIVSLIAGDTVLLHDGGYRETRGARGALPGCYRADFFHNRTVARRGSPAAGEDFLEFLAREPEYRAVQSQKIHFNVFPFCGAARTRVADVERGIVMDRLVVHLKERGAWLVADVFTATADGVCSRAVLYHASGIRHEGRGQDGSARLIATTRDIASDEIKAVWRNGSSHVLGIVFASDAGTPRIHHLRRHYTDAEVLCVRETSFLKRGNIAVAVSLLMPILAGKEAEALWPELTVDRPLESADAGFRVKLAWADERWTVLCRLDPDFGCGSTERRPIYDFDSSTLDFGGIKSDALFACVRRKEGTEQACAASVSRLEYEGRTLLDVPSTSHLQPDFTLEERISRWNAWSGMSGRDWSI